MEEVRKIYLDMDGVLADFSRGVRELCGMEAAALNGKQDRKNDDLMWEAIRRTEHFYGRLELMPGAGELFHEIWRQYGRRCEILTGIPRPERGIADAAEDKIRWMHRMLSPEIRVNSVLRGEKIRFCRGPETVLIDDMEKTIREWTDRSGTGILFKSAGDTLRKMILLRPVNGCSAPSGPYRPGFP